MPLDNPEAAKGILNQIFKEDGERVEISPSYLADKTLGFINNEELVVKNSRPVKHDIDNTSYEYLRVTLVKNKIN